MKIAAAQIACSLGDVGANVRKMRDFSAEARRGGADLVVFPEVADTGYAMPVIEACATSWDEGAVPELQKIAKELSIAIICGVSERDGSSIYNSQVFIEGTGNILASYRKAHLFAVGPSNEQTCFAPGNALASAPAGGFRFGLSICYDIRFPEVYRALAIEHEANVLIISSAWPFPRVDHLRTLAIARAIENQSYMIVSNRVGADDGVSFCGSSAIIDPYGITISLASTDREELIVAEISKEAIAAVRDKMPVFAHRRRDLYGERLSSSQM